MEATSALIGYKLIYFMLKYKFHTNNNTVCQQVLTSNVRFALQEMYYILLVRKKLYFSYLPGILQKIQRVIQSQVQMLFFFHSPSARKLC